MPFPATRNTSGNLMQHKPALAGLLVAAIVTLPCPASADVIQIHGYGDVRLVSPSDEVSWSEGGLGKLRFNNTSGRDLYPTLAELVVEGSAQITPEMSALVSLRYAENQRSPIDVNEAYVRYRPVSTSEWRWSVRAGAFYAPISLENDEIGWTSTWTLTPSAINSWVGDELRTIGVEGEIELRGPLDSFEAVGAVYGWNDPAGVLIADRGWSLNDRPTALFDRPREPDVLAPLLGLSVPAYTPMYKEIDDRMGWYGGVTWRRADVGSVSALYYDNRADPAAVRDQIAWRTEFWSLAAQTQIGNVTILAQGMSGETEIAPFAPIGPVVLTSDLTRFDAAYVLAGWKLGDWRTLT